MFRIVLSFSVLLAASAGSAQSTSSPFICQTNAGVPPIVRAESRTETVGDYVVVCSGGTQGQPVTASFTIFLNTNVTSRVLSDSGTSEALLLVDEPGSAQQVPGTNVFAAKKGPQGENSLLFANVPFTQPGSGGARVFRFTNIRIDASLVGVSSSLIPSQILAFLSVDASLSVAIDNPQQTLAFVLSAIQSTVRLPDDTGGSVLLPSCTAQNAALLNSPTATTGTASFDLRFREGFQTAFKTRSSGSDPATPSAQDIPGVVFNTETGFFNPQYPATDGLHKAGMANHGTRLMARFLQIPPGVKLFVTTSAKTRTISPSAATLVAADDLGSGVWSPLTQTTTAVISGEATGIRPLEITNGTATAVWEVTNANPAEIDSLLATVLVAYQGPIAPGTMQVVTSLAPIRASSVMSSTAPIPGFADSSSTGLVTFTAGCSAPADLTATLLTGATIVYQGQTLPVTATIRNTGGGPAGGFSAVVSLFSSSEMNTVLSSAAACTFDSLAAAASATCQRDLPIPAGLTPGTYYAGIVVDGANSVPEVDKTNNRANYSVAVQLRPISAPQPAAIAPASGSGYTQTFAATYLTQKPNGAEPDAVYFLAAPTITAVNACLIEYTPLSGTFRLLGNDGATWSASMTTGGTDLQNSQCTVHGNSSGSTNILSDTMQRNLVNYAVTFKSGYGGSKNLYLLAMNAALGLNSGWVAIGAWEVPSAGAVVSLQPLNGAAMSGTFTSTFQHTGGASAHYLGYTLFLPTPNVVNYTAQGTCLVEYNRISRGVRLIDNSGTGWLGGAPIGSTAQSLSNNQCTIQVSAMTATVNGTMMTVTIPVTFKSVIGPVLGTFLQALDVHGNWTGMTQFGNWGVPGAQQTRVGPAFAGIQIQAAATPNSRKLTTYIAHPAGAAGLSMVTMLAASGISATKTCQVVFVPGLGINLIDDARTAMVSPTWATPGQNVTLANSHCSFNASGVIWQPGSTSVLTMPIAFASPGFSGAQTIYVNAFDVTGRTTHWATAGSVTVP